MGKGNDFFQATLIGGALGDALGYSVEFTRLAEIKAKYGYPGITDLQIDKRKGTAVVSDDTQMTLFTADGILWAYKRSRDRGIGSYAGSGTYQSYLRWYYTQTNRMPTEQDKFFLNRQPHEEEGSILDWKELYAQRAPGNTCLSALGSGKMGTCLEPINNSKGCGGVMRVAPVGLFLHHNPYQAFYIGADVAAITHGHPTGYLSAGALAMIIAELINGKSIRESTEVTMKVVKEFNHHEETLKAMEQAITLAESNLNEEAAITKLGEGWVAEEALAIALYCALKEKDFKKALIFAVNHDGDSDSTGAICGNILGAAYGMDSIPQDWMNKVELKELIIELSDKLFNTSEQAFNR